MMSTSAKTSWRIAGECFGGCNCAWGCPCQFNALPTQGCCEGVGCWHIREGHFGDTRLDGSRFAFIISFPGPIHDGDGTLQIIIDQQATPDQRAALTALWSGTQGGPFFEIFTSVCPHQPAPIIAPISLEIDRERRLGLLHIPGLIETRAEPIKNPVTGEEHRARIVLPNGFEYKEAEMANTVSLRATGGGKLTFQHTNCYAQMNAFDWSNA